MKYVKILGVAAMVASAMMVLAASASATALYSSGSKLGVETEIVATLAGETARLTTTGGTTLDTCTNGSVTGEIDGAGGASATVTGDVLAADLDWENCTATTTTTAGGELEIHQIGETTNGTLTAKGFDVVIDTIFGECGYGAANGTDLGTLTGKTASNAVMDINAVVVLETDNGFCPASGKWVATYNVTTPANLYVEGS